MDTAWLIAIGSVCCAGVGVLGFWMHLSDRITRAQTEATNALQTAAEAGEDIKEARGAIAAMQTSFALYRESVIEKFATYEAVAAVEHRLIESQAKSEQRLVDAIAGINGRLDRLLEAERGR
ncbi:MAG: hypothetical protein J0H89_10790 [Rhizobiales bacterium]|jgi:hypothetical protein|nr:hypothetical protein [Hyphomicrobiales bacterium]